MLLGKISPAAVKIVEVNPFSSTTKSLDYISVIARPYVAGATNTNFNVNFGTITKDESGDVTSFDVSSQTNVTMTSEELSTWGTDDQILLTLVATKIHTSVTEFANFNKGFNM